MNRKLRAVAALLEISTLLCLFSPVISADETTSLSEDTTEFFETMLEETSAKVPDHIPDSAPETDSEAEAEPPAPGEEEPAPKKPDFPDVFTTDWFYNDVARLVAEDIIHGYPDGSFDPDGNITYAEFTKMLISVVGGDMTDVSGGLFEGHWASEFISFAHEKGIITDEDIAGSFSPDMPISRSRMTKMMVLALGIPLVRIQNPFLDLADKPDIYADTAYNEYLLRGYPAEDGYRIYDGDGNAARSEAAAIIVRVMDYKSSPYEYRKNAILDNAKNNILLGESELIDLFYILNREFITEFTFETPIPYEEWSEYYKLANIIHLEHFYASYLHCSYIPSQNKYTIKLEYSDGVEKLKGYVHAAEEKAAEVLSEIITEGMTDIDKIKAIHDYIILNCKYDYDNYIAGTLPFEARLAYGVLVNGSAICQGYSAAFNLLCKMAGIRSIVVTGTAPDNPDSHAWNGVLIDGGVYFVDATHDDPVPDIEGRVNYDHFLIGMEELNRLGYRWNGRHVLVKYFY